MSGLAAWTGGNITLDVPDENLYSVSYDGSAPAGATIWNVRTRIRPVSFGADEANGAVGSPISGNTCEIGGTSPVSSLVECSAAFFAGAVQVTQYSAWQPQVQTVQCI